MSSPRARRGWICATGHAARFLPWLCVLPGCASVAVPQLPGGALDAELAILVGRARQAAPSAHLSTPAWREGQRRLEALRRRAEGSGPRTLRVRLALREPRTGQLLEARGAIAIAPLAGEHDGSGTLGDSRSGGALRMILLGPGGTTALDLWARGDRFRIAIPAIDLLKRGDASTPRAAMRGLPVDFLRWWLLRPADGALFWCERSVDMDGFFLRDGDAVVELWVAEDGRIGARRATWSKAPGQRPHLLDEEVVIADGLGCGRVRYAQASTGLLITVTCEGEERERAPDPRAFMDPDATQAGGDS